MLLAIDIGNTHTSVGLYEQESSDLMHTWRLRTDRGATAEQLMRSMSEVIAMSGFELSREDAVVMSSTVPALGERWREVCARFLKTPPLIVGSELEIGMEILYDRPEDVGPDRIADAVAGYERAKRACVIVDFGTATTYNAVSNEGNYLGGIITPGVGVSISALLERAAMLPPVELTRPTSLIGRSTVDALSSGVAYGFADQVEGIVRRLKAEIGDNAYVVATGGHASKIVPFTDGVIDEVDDVLTLTGLRLIYQRVCSES